MSTFEINGNSYQTASMPVMTQFHVMRRMAPVLGKMAQNMTGMVEARAAIASGEEKSAMAALLPLAEAIAELSDADCEFVLNACLAVTKRQEGANWIPIWNINAKRLQFQDIDLAAMLTIAGNVLTSDLAGFLGGNVPTA